MERFQESLTPLQHDYLILAYASATEGLSASKKKDDDKAPSLADKLTKHLSRLQAKSAAIAYKVASGRIVEEAMLVHQTPPGIPLEATSGDTTPKSSLQRSLPLTSPRTLAYATFQSGAHRPHDLIFERFLKRWEASKLSPLETIATDWRHCFTSMWSVQLEPVETLSLTETDPGIEPLAAILVFPLADSRS